MNPDLATSDEARRLEALRSYGVLDTLPEQALDELTKLAAAICEAPVALISLVDEHRQWFKARVGVEVTETPRDIAFSAHALEQPGLFIVPDATQDERFAQNPAVTGELGVRFYAGAPLVTPEGAALGTLCVIDRVPRTLSPLQEQALQVLGRQVMIWFELRRHTRELRESEERHRSVVESALEAIVTIDHENRIADFNPAAEKIFGRRKAEVLGRDMAETLVPPAFREAHRRGLARYLETGAAVIMNRRIEVTALRSDGTEFPIELTVTRLGHKTPPQFMSFLHDITERQRSEAAVRASEADFRASFFSSAIGQAQADAETGRYLRVNPKFCEITGYSAEELLQMTFHELTHPEDRPRNDATHALLVVGEITELAREKRYLRKDGSAVWVSINASIIRDEAGRALRTLAVVQDITARREAEAAVRGSAERLRLITDLVPHGIFAKDAAGRYIFVNRALAEACDLSAEEILGKTDFEVVANQAQAEAFRADDLAVMAAGTKKFIAEETLTNLSGRTRFLQTSKIPFIIPESGERAVLGAWVDITERKQAEEARRASEERYRTLFEHAPDGIVIANSEGDYLHANLSYCRMLGYTHEELKSLSARDILVEAEMARLAPALKTIKSKSDYHQEWKFRRKDGSIFPVDAISTVMPDGNLLAMIRDITARKEAEAQLRLLETCVARLNDIVIITDAETLDEPGPRILFVNDAFVRQTGYTREEVLGKSPRFLQGPKTSRAELDRIGAALRQWKPVRAELINYTKNGEEFWLELDIVPVADPTGWFTHWVAVERDISDRRRIEETARESQFRLERIIHSVDGIFWEADAATLQFTFVSQQAVRVLGYPVEQWLQEPTFWRDHLHPEDRDAAVDLCVAATSRLESHVSEYRMIAADGRAVWVKDLVTVMAKDGRAVKLLGILVDITERKKLEQQFLRSQRMESIGTLAGGIAHDLNNALGPIILSLEMLKMKFTDPDSQELLAIISSSAQRGADMVSQVLSFARGVEGRRMEVPVKQLLREIEKIVNETFVKNIQVRTTIPQDLWPVIGDPTQLHQVLLNLCVNARDAMPRGGTLTITAENLTLDAHYAALSLSPEAQPGPYVYLQVQDSGTGISPEIVEKIFDPFFTTKELGQGTGLGLSTSLAILKSHGGFIRVYSEPRKGTTFRVYLPAQTEASPDLAAELAAKMPHGGGELILVVDDELAVRQITKQTLETFGYRVVLANDGAEAVAVYARQGAEIAAVLTDMMMPIMDGPATIEVLRRINPAVRIIGASGLSVHGHVAHAASLGLKYFLPKPYAAETLLNALKQLLSDKS